MSKVDSELDELIYTVERGGGYGGGEGQQEELDRRAQVLMHRQNLNVKKADTYLAIFNVVIATANISLLAYQVFYMEG